MRNNDATRTGTAGEIGSIKAAATHELVADQIRRAIFLGRFMPGDKLPAERDLAGQMSVSRTTLREAIRVLEGEGILGIRRGATGGLVVLDLDRLDSREIEAHLRTQRSLIDNIFDYRIANECVAASLAASRRSGEHLAHLAAALEDMATVCATPESRAVPANVGRFLARDSDFHLTIANASANPFLLRAIEDSRTAMFMPIGKVFVRLEVFVNDHHAAIYQAIHDRDAEAAGAHMKAHIEVTRESVIAMFPRI